MITQSQQFVVVAYISKWCGQTKEIINEGLVVQTTQIEKKIDESTGQVMQHNSTIAKTNADRTIETLSQKQDQSDKQQALDYASMQQQLRELKQRSIDSEAQLRQRYKEDEEYRLKSQELGELRTEKIMQHISASTQKNMGGRPLQEIDLNDASQCSNLDERFAASQSGPHCVDASTAASSTPSSIVKRTRFTPAKTGSSAKCPAAEVFESMAPPIYHRQTPRKSCIPPPKNPMGVTPRSTRQSKRIASATKIHLKQTEARRTEEQTRDSYSIHRR